MTKRYQVTVEPLGVELLLHSDSHVSIRLSNCGVFGHGEDIMSAWVDFWVLLDIQWKALVESDINTLTEGAKQVRKELEANFRIVDDATLPNKAVTSDVVTHIQDRLKYLSTMQGKHKDNLMSFEQIEGGMKELDYLLIQVLEGRVK